MTLREIEVDGLTYGLEPFSNCCTCAFFRLSDGFEFSCKLADNHHREYMDNPCGNGAWRLLRSDVPAFLVGVENA